MYYNYRIRLTGSFLHKGFGFSCMQMAFEHRLTGTLLYESENSILIEISGREKDILMAIEMCKGVSFIREVIILSKTRTTKTFIDFIMLNQID